MDNLKLNDTICFYRKKQGLTQEELAVKLGVTNQSVSKWESAQCCPDISLIPKLADIFDVSIDELFGKEPKPTVNNYDLCTEFPWPDDTIIRGVVCEGRKILQTTSLVNKFTFEIIGEAKNVQSECNIEVRGNVSGGCKAGKNINVSGVVSGGCNSGAEIVIGGHLSGGCNSGGDITVSGSFSGGCNTGGSITCGGNLSGDVNSRGTVTVAGDVEAERIKGDVVCNSLKCERIEGDVTINKEN